MIRKESNAGIGYSVVDLGGVRHVFASAAAHKGGDLHRQAHDALATIEAIAYEEGTLGSIVHQAVFIKDIDQIGTCRQIVDDFYGNELPATSYIAQPPCGGRLIGIEAWGVGRGCGDVQIDRLGDQMVAVRHDGIAWLHCANIVGASSAAGTCEKAASALARMNGKLTVSGFRFEQMLRTWFYLGDILGSDGPKQRYHELNRARGHFFAGVPFGNGRASRYPASTGIGTSGRDITLSGIALATQRSDVTLLALENPRQTSAFDYGRQYGETSPKFSRAMAVLAGQWATIMISGTASIVNSESTNVGDVAGQTWETLDNIAAVMSEESFRRHGVTGWDATLDDLAIVRVYIKRQADYAAVRAVCHARLGETPAVYAVADICRPDLLVEIEGVAFCRRAEQA